MSALFGDQTGANGAMAERDLAAVWHPCSQMKDYEWLPMIPIKRGEGIYLEDFNGNRYLDAVSSWWVNLFGHCNPRINARIRDQLDQLEHVILAGCTHEPVIELSERLTAIAPPGLTRAFYADNGSSAVEVALKLSYHYWRNSGRTDKTRFVTLSNSYHGETLGALAVSNVALYKETYQPLLMEAIEAPSPDAFHRREGESWADCARRAFADIEQILATRHEEISAVIVEPLIQCAGGMRMHDPIYLSLLREACDRYGVHLIADEIAVGFGRTGTMFACEQADVSPDFLCLSKGLTGGYLPLSVTLTSEDVYAAFYDDPGTLKAFLHSHSYTGNPLGCAAALATLDIFAEDDVIARNGELAERMRAATEPLRDHPHIGDVRQHGMVVAMEMVRDKTTGAPYPAHERRGLTVFRHGLENGCLIRPLGHVVYLMPPYIITPEQIDDLARVAREGIDRATAD